MEQYAIIQTGNKQFLVKKGDCVSAELIEDAEVGKTIDINQVLMVGNGETHTIGNPYVAGACVRCLVQAETKGKKIHIYKFRRRNKSQVTKGHRQQNLKLLVESISL